MAVLALLVAVLARRWWVTGAALALIAAVIISAIHDHALHDSGLRAGQVQTLTVQLTAPAHTREGMSGPWWTAQGAVVAGAHRVPVAISGNGAGDYGRGDRLSAPMLIASPQSPGEAAMLRVRGSPAVTPAQSPAADARRTMLAVSGTSDRGWLLSGMTLGMDEGLTPAASEAMRASGLTHLTAVSGANCAVLVALVLWLSGWLRLSRLLRAALAGAVLLAFVFVVGPQPSLLRASLMMSLTLAAGIVGGRRAAAHVLQVSILLLILVDPWLAYSIGFMLSIAATAGLILAVERGPLAATFAAQIATLPIILAIGGTAGLRSVAANVLAAPLAAVIPIVGLLSLIAEALAGLGRPVAALGRGLTGIVLRIAGLPIPEPVAWPAGIAGMVMAVLLAATVFTLGRRRMVAVAAAFVTVVSVTVRVGQSWPPGDWWVVACDVGQGDALVVRSDTGTAVVDAGPDARAIDECLTRLGVRSIDLLVITHFHADHVSGLPGVLHGRSVGQVWISPSDEPVAESGEALAQLAGRPVSIPGPGSVYRLGDSQLQVVSAQRVINAGSVPNNSSLAFILSAPQGRIAFLADMEKEADAQALRIADLSADIVKVPHHGSANFDPRLPAAVHPDIALVSVGANNTFGHPTPEALSAWQALGAQVYTTMENSDIAVTRDLRVVVRGVSQLPRR